MSVDHFTHQEYIKNRNYVINHMRDYIHGNMNEKQLKNFQAHEKRATELSREIDIASYEPKSHSKFYDLMNK